MGARSAPKFFNTYFVFSKKLSDFMIKYMLFISKIQSKGEGDWRIWRDYHIAQPPDHLES